MKRRVVDALQARAWRELGERAIPLDYVLAFVARGGRMKELAALLVSDLGHPVSRSFVVGVVNRLTPDAKGRLAAARSEPESVGRGASFGERLLSNAANDASLTHLREFADMDDIGDPEAEQRVRARARELIEQGRAMVRSGERILKVLELGSTANTAVSLDPPGT